MQRAGVVAPVKGAHVLRHTAATEMLRDGVPLEDRAGPAASRHRHDGLLRQGRCHALGANRAALAGGSRMLKTIETYLALRRATGFAMLNTEYLLKSFAAFATERGQTHVHTQTAIDWAARGPSVAQRDARLKAVCRFVRHVRVETPGMSRRRSITSAPARRGARRISTHSGDQSPHRGRPSASTKRRLTLADLCDTDCTALPPASGSPKR